MKYLQLNIYYKFKKNLNIYVYNLTIIIYLINFHYKIYKINGFKIFKKCWFIHI